MKTATKEDYQRLIDIGQSMLKNTHERWHEIPVERLPVARFGQGSDALFVAVGHLMLGESKQARDWFAIAGQFFLEASKPPDSVTSEKRALECALFSGDREFQEKVARQILPREGSVKPVEYPYVMFLKHEILNEQIEVPAFVDDTAWLSRLTMKKRGGYGTLQDACQALAGRQSNGFAAALEALLQEHKWKAAQGGTKMPDGMVCFPGAALLILARRQGINVHVASPFIPVALLE
ncbi:MAG TPA: Imm49 family immunity protein [Anaerolineales bacterium]|nr:Imm49 family immunity protein [Anaerolineales bacterium]